MPDNITLLPCPFCESTDVRQHHEWPQIFCNKCGAYGPMEKSKATCKELWNKLRPIAEPRSSAQLTERDALRAQIITSLMAPIWAQESKSNCAAMRAAAIEEADAILASVQEPETKTATS